MTHQARNLLCIHLDSVLLVKWLNSVHLFYVKSESSLQSAVLLIILYNKGTLAQDFYVTVHVGHKYLKYWELQKYRMKGI